MYGKAIGLAVALLGAIIAATLIAGCLSMLPLMGPDGLQCQPLRRLVFPFFVLGSFLALGACGIGGARLFIDGRLAGRLTWPVVGGALLLSLVVILSVFAITPECPFPTR